MLLCPCTLPSCSNYSRANPEKVKPFVLQKHFILISGQLPKGSVRRHRDLCHCAWSFARFFNL